MLFVTGYADNANNWYSSGIKRTMVEYDVGTDAWAPRTDFPKALIGLNAVVHDNLMYTPTPRAKTEARMRVLTPSQHARKDTRTCNRTRTQAHTHTHTHTHDGARAHTNSHAGTILGTHSYYSGYSQVRARRERE